MDFVNRLVGVRNSVGGDDDGEDKYQKKQEKYAEKLDGFNFNFPSIPKYEGVQEIKTPGTR